MELRRDRPAGRADGADPLPAGDALSPAHFDSREMPEDRGAAGAVREHDHVAQPPEPAGRRAPGPPGEHHGSATRRENCRAFRRRDVHAGEELLFAGPGRGARPEKGSGLAEGRSAGKERRRPGRQLRIALLVLLQDPAGVLESAEERLDLLGHRFRLCRGEGPRTRAQGRRPPRGRDAVEEGDPIQGVRAVESALADRPCPPCGLLPSRPRPVGLPRRALVPLPPARPGEGQGRGDTEGGREHHSRDRQERQPALSRAADPQRPDPRAARGGMKLDLDCLPLSAIRTCPRLA